jgi:hypothetical protein
MSRLRFAAVLASCIAATCPPPPRIVKAGLSGLAFILGSVSDMQSSIVC